MATQITIIIVSLIATIAIFLIGRSFVLRYTERKTIERLSNILFPSGEDQMNETLDGIAEITQNRFTRDEILDYYLKIKGLQIIDLHAQSDSGIRDFLMKPTRVRLSYFEQVKFYEIYLNYPQAVGENVIEH